jgi:hypothetical protein
MVRPTSERLRTLYSLMKLVYGGYRRYRTQSRGRQYKSWGWNQGLGHRTFVGAWIAGLFWRLEGYEIHIYDTKAVEDK